MRRNVKRVIKADQMSHRRVWRRSKMRFRCRDASRTLLALFDSVTAPTGSVICDE